MDCCLIGICNFADSPTPTKLQYVGVPIINNTECERIYKPVNRFIDHYSICAGYPMGLKDSCEVIKNNNNK